MAWGPGVKAWAFAQMLIRLGGEFQYEQRDGRITLVRINEDEVGIVDFSEIVEGSEKRVDVQVAGGHWRESLT